MKSETLKTKLASLLFIMLPVLEYYGSFISALDLASFLLIIFFGYVCLTQRMKASFPNILYLVGYVMLITPISLVLFSYFGIKDYTETATIILRYIKFLLLLIIVFVGGIYKLFDFKIATHYMRIFVYISTAFIIIQRLVWIVGVEIQNPLLLFVRYGNSGEVISQGSSGLYRPSAFFLEPAHLAQYVLVFIVLRLFLQDRNRGHVIDGIVGSIAIICSTSGQGLLLLILVWGIFAYSYLKRNVFHAVGLLIVFGILSILIYQIDFVQQSLERIFTDDYAQSAISYRMGEGYEIFGNLPFIFKLIGCGFGNVPVGQYLNGLEYILNTLGAIGLIVFICIVGKRFFKVNLLGKVIILIYMCLIIGAQVFTAIQLCFVFTILYSSELQKGNLKDKDVYQNIKKDEGK